MLYFPVTKIYNHLFTIVNLSQINQPVDTILQEDSKIKIISIKVKDNEGLDFQKINLQEVNLFVGQSSSGKTKFLNSLFDIARFAISGGNCLLSTWEIEIEHGEYVYNWEYQGENIDNRGNIIIKEKIQLTEKKNNTQRILIDRDLNTFKFKDDIMPKLSPTSSSIFLFKEEADIKPLYEGLSKVIRRNFSGGELLNASAYSNIPPEIQGLFENKNSKNYGLHQLFNHNLNIRLYLIDKYFHEKYKEIIMQYKSIFRFIEECSFLDLSKTNIKLPMQGSGFAPIFAIRESGVAKNLMLQELSSGMIKVLLILTDILTLPDNSIYLMDEYENSLGVNAIDFLPSILLEHQNNKQFLITSHHPYLINQMPISNWYVLHRKGSTVEVKFGEELTKRYGKSKQEAFTKLMNDPFYNMGS